MGRPKRQFTEQQMQEMGEYAYNGAQTKTIAGKLGLNESALRNRKDISEFLTKKRQEGKLDLLGIQRKQAKNTPAMAIWLGKNQLGQTDRTDHNVNVKFEPIKVDMG